jgi:hypothetical protein
VPVFRVCAVLVTRYHLVVRIPECNADEYSFARSASLRLVSIQPGERLLFTLRLVSRGPRGHLLKKSKKWLSTLSRLNETTSYHDRHTFAEEVLVMLTSVDSVDKSTCCSSTHSCINMQLVLPHARITKTGMKKPDLLRSANHPTATWAQTDLPRSAHRLQSQAARDHTSTLPFPWLKPRLAVPLAHHVV